MNNPASLPFVIQSLRLDGQECLKEFAARATVLLGNFDSHQSQLKKLVEQSAVEHRLFVHFLGQRTNLVVGKLANVVAEQNFVFRNSGERRGVG
jgi:hypothetical protein